MKETVNTKLIRLRSVSNPPYAKGQKFRRYRNEWEAEYPFKGYTARGRTREEALGKLLIQVAGYLGVEIE